MKTAIIILLLVTACLIMFGYRYVKRSAHQPPIDKHLIGTWRLDRTEDDLDKGDGATCTFSSDGKLDYTIQFKDYAAVMKMTYTIEGNEIVSDQPSQPHKERTRYEFLNALVVNANETLFYPADDRSDGLLIHTSCGTASAFGGPFTNRSGCSA